MMDSQKVLFFGHVDGDEDGDEDKGRIWRKKRLRANRDKVGVYMSAT